MKTKTNKARKYGAWYCHECDAELKRERNVFCEKCDVDHFVCANCGKSCLITKAHQYHNGECWICKSCAKEKGE